MAEPFAPMTDIFLSYEGDIEFEGGDIKLCNGIECLKRDIFKLLITEPGDWKIYPEEGASPNKFTGEQNTRDNARLLEKYVVEKVQPHVIPATVIAKAVPISRESVKVYLDINIAGMDILNIPFTLDYINGIAYPQIDEEVDSVVSSLHTKYNDSDSVKNPNPIWDRIRKQ
jgi:hypothetical protein